MCRAAPTGMRSPARSPTARSDGPPVSRTRSVSMTPASVSTAGDPRAVGRRAQPGEGHALAQLDPRGLHRQDVGADVARRVDVAIGVAIAPAAMAVRGERRDGRPSPRGGQPAHVGQALGVLHRDPRPTGPFVVLGHGQDQVAVLAKAGVGAVRGRLAAIEVDRPATEGDRRRRPALGPHDPGCPRRRTDARPAAIHDDDPTDVVRRREHRRPAAERAGADDDEVRTVGHRGRIGRRRVVTAGRREPRAGVAAVTRRAPRPPRRPRPPRDGRAGRTSVGAGPSRPRGRDPAERTRAADRGSIACHSAAMATQSSSTASAIVAGSRSQRVQPAGPGRRLAAPPARARPARTTTRRRGRGRRRVRRPGPRRRPGRRPP